MPTATDTLLSELSLQRSGPRTDPWGGEPGSEIWRASLTHPVLHRMLAKAEEWAPMLGLTREVVFGLLRDLMIEESERSPLWPGGQGARGRARDSGLRGLRGFPGRGCADSLCPSRCAEGAGVGGSARSRQQPRSATPLAFREA